MRVRGFNSAIRELFIFSHLPKGKINMTSSTQPTQSSKGDNQGGIQKGKSGRGFSVMDPKRQREIASEGGKAAHLSGNAWPISAK